MTSLFDCFSPFAAHRLADRTADDKFVHYTSAEAAVSIFTHREVWMRACTVMNDLSEARFGFAQLRAAWEGTDGDRMKAILNSCFPGISGELEKAWNANSNHIISDTYMTCLSEHPLSEWRYGRLSMWRAYARGAGVALVLNPSAILSSTNSLQAYSSPVEYHDRASFAESFKEVCGLLDANRDLIASSESREVFSNAFTMLRFAVHCTKHLGFAEEKEWRVIHTPKIDLNAPATPPVLRRSIQIVGNIPQIVYKIPLENIEANGLVGMTPDELISRVLIGPTAFREATYDALFDAMENAGVKEPADRLSFSDIPLRIP
jgi:Protein of unknown function (DUF2971)